MLRKRVLCVFAAAFICSCSWVIQMNLELSPDLSEPRAAAATTEDTPPSVSDDWEEDGPFKGNITLPLCLVHVGKSAGSSVSCGLGFSYANCEGIPRDPIPGTYSFHMGKNFCPPTTETFVVTLRNPITRMESWFNFEKDIIPTRANKAQQEAIRRKRELLFVECYSTFIDLALDGLRPLETTNTVTASTIQNMTCPERAWAAVMGARSFSYHEWFNYEYYWSGIVPKINAKVVALRTEYLQEDWNSISNERLFRQVNRGPTTNDSVLVRQAYDNLCRALCDEIQFYKRFLNMAANLDERQRIDSMDDLRKHCPSETNEIVSCPDLPVFPKLSSRQYNRVVKKRFYQPHRGPK